MQIVYMVRINLKLISERILIMNIILTNTYHHSQ